MATITIDVLDTSLARTGGGPLTSAYDVEFDEPLSMCGLFSFTVPARDQRAALLVVQKSIVRIYDDGTAVFLGIVESKERQLDAGRGVFRVSGRSYLAALTDQSVGFLALVSGSSKVTSGPSSVLSATSPTGLASGWSLDTTNGASATGRGVYAQFRGETRLSALVKIAEKTGEGFLYKPHLSGSGDKKVIWLSSYTDSNIRAIQGGGEAVALEGNPNICLIRSLTELEDGGDLANRVVPFGAGDDLENSALTTAASSYSGFGSSPNPDWFTVYPGPPGANTVDWDYSFSTLLYRQREAVVQFQDIAPISNTDADQQTAANMLADVAMRWLERHGIPHKFYELEVIKLPAGVYAGKKLRVIYYEEDTDGTVLHDINTDLYILNVSTAYGNDGSKTHRLLVSTTDRFPTSEGEMIAARVEKAQVYGSYTQLGPSIDTICHTEDFDYTTGAEINFWLGAEIAQVQQVLLRFKISPLRSTVQSVAGSSTTTDSGGSSTPTSGASSAATSDAEGAHVHTTPAHYHSTVVVDGSAYTLVANANLYTSGGIYYIGHEAGGSSHDVLTKLTGEGGTTSAAGAAHAHNIPHTHDVTITGHTHDLTPIITASYGIFEDSGANVIDSSTLAILKTEILLSVNGTFRTSSIVDSSAADWYELDITAWVSSITTFRPTQAANVIIVSAANAGDRGRITAQLQIRALVQSVAYS